VDSRPHLFPVSRYLDLPAIPEPPNFIKSLSSRTEGGGNGIPADGDFLDRSGSHLQNGIQ